MPQEYDIAIKYFPTSTVIKIEHSPTYNFDSQVPSDCRRIVSFGLAGGLASGFEVGDIAIATKLHAPDFDYNLSGDWYQNIERILDGTNLKFDIAWWYSSGGTGEANSVEQRAALAEKYKTSVIDDESYFVAKFAKEHNLEAAIVRSISDDWQMDLPPAATGNALNADGSPNLGHVMNSIFTNPLQIPALIGVALDFSYSLGTLKQTAIALGENFGYYH